MQFIGLKNSNGNPALETFEALKSKLLGRLNELDVPKEEEAIYVQDLFHQFLYFTKIRLDQKVEMGLYTVKVEKKGNLIVVNLLLEDISLGIHFE
jgi:hypothetical protein